MTKKEIFEDAPISKAVRSLALPTIISQLVNLIYNLTDTFYVGRTGDAYKIAGVSVAFTLFMIMISLTNMTGIGGGSLISRLLGQKEDDRAKVVSSFSFYLTIVLATVFSVIVLIFMEPLLRLLGASDATLPFAKQYTLMVIVAGSIPMMCASVLAHIIRCLGYSKQASIGLSGGGILNMILDPLFMFVILPDGMEVFGAALATTLSNVAVLVFFIIMVNKIKHEASISLDPKIAKPSESELGELFSIGVPSAVLTLMYDLTTIVLNKCMAVHGDLQLAAMGIVLKAERIPNATAVGISQGTLPLTAYNYASGNEKRRDASIRYGRRLCLLIALCSIVLYEICAPGIVKLFMDTSGSNMEAAMKTIEYGTVFLRIRALAAPFMVLNIHSSLSMQAVNYGKGTTVHSVVRQMVFNIPLIILFDSLFGDKGIVGAFIAGEALAAALALVLLNNYLKKPKESID